MSGRFLNGNGLAGVLALVALLVMGSLASAQGASPQKPDYLNPTLPVEVRIKDLLARMTLEEKARQMDMYRAEEVTEEREFSPTKTAEVIGDLGVGAIHDLYLKPALANQAQKYAVEKTRLGIPVLVIEECLHGVCGWGYTIFPQAIGLAGTWDKELVRRIGAVIGAEGRASGMHQCLSPVLGLSRDPRWGRTEETYGEDPYLASRMAVAMVSGMQGKSLNTDHSVIAEPKHFAAHSIPEGGRNTAPTHVGERELREVFLPVFRAAFVEGGAMSVMSAYSEIDGVPCTSNKWLLTEVLRQEWGFRGFVLTDLGALAMLDGTHHVADGGKEGVRQAIEAGVDMQFYDYAHEYFQGWVIELVQEGKLSMAAVDRAVGNIVRVKLLLGLFENPYTDTTLGPKVIHCPEHRQLALQAAREAICLLKNDGGLLPLSKDVKSIAVIGPSADVARLGDYSGGGDAVTVLEGIRALVSPQTKVVHARGTGILDGEYARPIPSRYLIPPDGQGHGLKGEYFDNLELAGEPALVRTDKEVNFDWGNGSPDPRIRPDQFSVRWTGTLTPDETVQGWIAATTDDGVRLWVDGRLLIDDWRERVATTSSAAIKLEAGREYEIRLEYYENAGQASATLGWSVGPSEIEAAAEVAAESEVAIVVVGDSDRTSGETRDRADLDLPGAQLDLIKAVYATGTPVVVVLLNGRPMSINWTAEKIPAILEAWYPGEAGGTAIAEVLLGDYNPAGRLPITFPKSVGQLPLYYNYKPSARGQYILMNSRPLYPFGYGLSYTEFAYSNLRVSPDRIGPAGTLTVSVDVENAGERAGDEVVQLYLRDLVASVTTPVKALKGFERVHLAPGQKRAVTFTLGPEQLAVLDRNFDWVVEPGTFEVMVGGSSEDGLKAAFVCVGGDAGASSAAD
jgi:beta-glucosidase